MGYNVTVGHVLGQDKGIRLLQLPVIWGLLMLVCVSSKSYSLTPGGEGKDWDNINHSELALGVQKPVKMEDVINKLLAHGNS